MVRERFSAAMDRILGASGTPERIVIALSGGMDSVALLHLMLGWARERGMAQTLLAAHLNHGLRGAAADGDEAFSRRFAEGLGVPFASEKADVRGAARRERLGIEEAGRLLRYGFFKRLTAGGNDMAAVGHHADDQAETILMHLRRGAHRRGLVGMREFTVMPLAGGGRIHVVRPMLDIPRDDLARYAAKHGLSWREDESNADPAFLRNRIRHGTIPALEAILPGFRARLLAKARLLADEEAELTAAGRMLAETFSRREPGGLLLRLDPELFAVPERLLYALRHVLEEEMGARLPYGAALSRLAVLAETGGVGESLSLPGRLRAGKESDGLFFSFAGDGEGGESPADEILLPDPPFDIETNGLAVTSVWLPATSMTEADRQNRFAEWFNPRALRWPLCLRPPRPGERFRPLGAPGSRKLQDVMVDLKIPRRKRGGPIVLADHAGAIWLWPHRLAHRVRLDGGDGKALRVEITPPGQSDQIHRRD
ncbi:MAG: tRNA lysidine(34) synthetase TilS [Planctomycetota bacterium]|jgi:tRNA(Ile)-lysidine synthase|nr:tRNA lysidine(34) synthetase TilS [Planctomycetota bacterium]